MASHDALAASFGLLVAHTQNLGDDIQAIAARQFLPNVDYYLDRESLSDFSADQSVYTIFNGWFLHRTHKWPPSPDIKPLFVSFHIASSSRNQLLSKTSIRYLAQFQPIGARDYYTAELLNRHGVEAYFSGCLTLTLNGLLPSSPEEDRLGVLIIDLMPEVEAAIRAMGRTDLIFATQMLHTSLSDRSRSISPLKKLIKRLVPSHHYSELQYILSGKSPLNPEHRLLLAEKRLEQIASAQLVVTSRLHVALPAAALGTPVLFVPRDIDDPRFEGLKELVNTIKPYELISHFEDYVAHPPGLPDPKRLLALQNDLRKRAQEFINQARSNTS